MHVRLLGPLTVLDDHGRPVAVRGPKQRVLLACLARSGGRSVSAGRLAAVLWGDAPGDGWRNRLQAQVSQLRRTIGGDRVVADHDGYRLAGVTVDVDEFEAEIRRGSDGDEQALADAVGRWHGLAAELRDHPELAADGARIEQRWLDASERLLTARVARGDVREAITTLEDLTASHPYREPLWTALVTALHRAGRQADALRAYERARRILADDLGIEPGVALREAERAVLEQRPPARKATASRPTTPPAATGFVGRDDDVRRLGNALAVRRVVTLVGPGGVGKTRLARETVAGWWVDLVGAHRNDPSSVATAVNDAIAPSDRRAPAAPDDGRLGPAVDVLRDEDAVVVLDNAEHVATLAADAVEELLVACPRLRIVVTSREPLGVAGEEVVTLAPLAEGDAERLFRDRAALVRTLSPTDDVALSELCRRLDGLPLALELAASRVRSLTLTDLLDNIGRAPSLLSQRRAATPHHRSLEATLDWSYELLAVDERALFARLAVFVDGWTLAGAVEVARGLLAPAEVVDVHARLVDRSLVVADLTDPNGRYRMLATVRDHAGRRLAASSDLAEAERALAAWARWLVRGLGLGMLGPDAPSWRARVVPELGNLRVAFELLCAKGDGDGALDLALELAWLRFARAEFELSAAWLRRALGVAGEPTTSRQWTALSRAAYFESFMVDEDAGLADGERALAALRPLGNVRHLTDALLYLASQYASRSSNPSRAIELTDEAIAVARNAGLAWAEAMAHTLQASGRRRLGDVTGATAAASHAHACFQALGDRIGQLETLQTLVRMARQTADGMELRRLIDEAIELAPAVGADTYLVWFEAFAALDALANGDVARATELSTRASSRRGSSSATAFTHVVAGVIARRTGDREGARHHAAEAARWSGRRGTEWSAAAALAGWLELDDGHPARAEPLLVEAVAEARRRADPRVAAWALDGLALAAVHQGDTSAAQALLAEADAVRRDGPAPLLEEGPDRALVERRLASASGPLVRR